MKLCYFGIYNPSYSRNRVIIKGLKKNGVHIVECNVYSSTSYLPRVMKYASKFVRLIKKHVELDYDAMIIGHPGQHVVPVVRALTKKPRFLNALVGDHEVFLEREPAKGRSFKAKAFYLLDKKSFEWADFILTDTNQHINYFRHTLGLERNKFLRVFVGADDEVFRPISVEKYDNNFTVMFWGTFIPLHGVQHIIKAAKLLEVYEDIKFEIIGSGHTFDSVKKLHERLKITNLTFHTQWIPYQKLPNYIAEADVCLGIFAGTPQAMRVVPNKAYEALAMRKPLLTGDSPGVREVLTNAKNCILCQMANPEAIAESILLLRNDEKLRKKIAKNGYALFKEKLTPMAIGKGLKVYLEDRLSRRK